MLVCRGAVVMGPTETLETMLDRSGRWSGIEAKDCIEKG
jgi:hypothetical protein